MQHLNGNLLCAIDTETTGLDPLHHEICQICILPLDANIEPVRELNPFYIEIKPEYPERIDPKAMSVNRLTMATIGQRGHEKDKAADLLEEWIDGLGLPCNKYGNRCKIMPLGQNYTFDKHFILSWIGQSLYDELFFFHYRDTMIAAGYLDDRSSFVGEPCPFGKCSLSSLANKVGVAHDQAHDAIQDCLTTAKVYKKMLTHTNFGLLG